MKRLSVLLILLLFSIFFAFLPRSTHAAGSLANWQKGETIVPTNTTDYDSSSFQTSLKNLQATGANYVTLIIPYYQSDLYTSSIQGGYNTPTDASLIAGIDYAHSIGLHVMLAPHIDPTTGDWRAYINPSDKAGWFSNYGQIMSHLATIAQAHNVEEICIGSELITLSTYTSSSANTGYWDTLISKIRSIFSGKLTYSSNWGPSGFVDEKDHIAFWNILDYIGISAYFNLTSQADASVSQLEGAWGGYISNIQSLSNTYQKPVLFTEIGYRSVKGANTQPWNYSMGGPADQTEQANDYTALFDYWSNYPWMIGVQIWQWSVDPNAGGPNDNGYTVQNKSAQQVLITWFSQGGGSGGGGTQPAFSMQPTSVSPSSPSVNQQATISTGIKDTGGNTSGIITDMEIYAGSTKVFQQYFQNQSFSTNQAQNYTINWTPQSAGVYQVKLGVFNSTWSTLYYWNNSIINITVGQSPTPTPTGSTVSVWWPTNKVTVSGTQPFKAVLNGASLSSYNMYWQVDNGQFNLMQNATDHKESLVDLSGWNWRGNGPYMLTFTAKDLNGNVISSTSVAIYISH